MTNSFTTLYRRITTLAFYSLLHILPAYFGSFFTFSLLFTYYQLVYPPTLSEFVLHVDIARCPLRLAF